MVGKTAVAGTILVTLFVLALVDKYFFPLAVILCCVVIYVSLKKLLKTWVEEVLSKAERAQLRYSRHQHRRTLIKLRSTFASGILLPWIEKIIRVVVKKLKQRPPNDEDYEQDDFSPSSEYSYGFPAEVQNVKYCGSSPTETNEIKTFVNNISQSYIQSWYKSISNHEEFVQDLDYILEDVLVNLCGRISKLNVNQLFNQIFILVHNHILKYYENAFEDKSQGTNFRKKRHFQAPQLHPALKNHKTEMVYLSTVCGTLVDLVGPQDMLLCPLIRTLLTEILTKNLLLPTVNLVTDPAFLFWTIVFFFGDSNLLNRISRTTDTKSTLQQESTVLKRNLELNLSIQNIVRQRLQKVEPVSTNYKGKLTKARSLSYNSLLELNLESVDYKEKDGEIPLSPNRVPSDSNLFSLKNEIELATSNLWNTTEGNEYYVSRPPFSLFPVPGHSSKAEQEQSSSRKSSPTRLFQRLPKRKSKCLPRSSSLHSSQSLDQLLLPPTKVFQPNGTHVLPPLEASPAPTFSLDVEQAEEATEAADVQQFYNIRIVGTNELYDTAKKKYILYCIQYDYLEPTIGELKDNETRSLVPCTAVVRRRFREFLALQSRLEKSKLKKHLNGIKGPSKWLSSPFPAIDKHNVEKRRLFLQNYLQKLCSKEALANTPELHEFLAYKGDARIAFVKKAPELPVPRLDKMVVKCVMGTIDLLKTALPSMPQESSPSSGAGPKIGPQGEKSQASTRSILTGFTRNKSDTKLLSMEFICRVERVSPLSQHIYNFLDSFDTSSSPEDSRPNSPIPFSPFRGDADPAHVLLTTTGPAWKRAASRLDILQSLPPPPGPRLRGDGCDSLDLTREESDQRTLQLEKIQESFQTEIPLANTMVDMFLCIFYPMRSLSDDYAVVAFKVLFGDILQKWLQKELHCLSSQENCINYMHNLHEVLWPPSGQSPPKIKDLETCLEAAFQTLMSFFPGALTFLLGISDVGDHISTALDCLRNNQANRNLLYQVIDVITDMMCAQDLQQPAL